jgi:ubiquinone/menaquinone biosynthesis C-methylase UbiE
LVKHANVASVEAIDYEQQFVDAVRERNTDPRINIQRGDACQLEFSDGQFDRALSMLVLHFVTDPERAVFEMRRVVRSGGVVAATVWDNFGGQPATRMFWDTSLQSIQALLIGVAPVLRGRRHGLANSLASLRRSVSSTSWKPCSVSKWVLQTSKIIGFR